MNRLPQLAMLTLTALSVAGIRAQEGSTPANPWLLESYRPVVGVQFCENPRVVGQTAFEGTQEECRAEFDQLFVKCTTELPNVRLPAEFNNAQEQAAAIALLYECISSHYIGGSTLEEFNRRYSLEPQVDAGRADQ